MRLIATLLAALVYCGPAAAADLEVQLRNEFGAAAVIAGPDGRTLSLEDQKEGALPAPPDGKRLVVTVKGCDYAYDLPQALDALRAVDDGPVKMLIAGDEQLYWVPFELILYTPPRFLDAQQPGGFPLSPGKPVCRP